MVNPKNKKVPGYAVLGFLLIILVNIFLWMTVILNLGVDSFTKYYFPLIWFGFILFVDGLVYRFRGSSLIKNNFKDFIGLFIISFLLWIAFELIANYVQVWSYIKIHDFSFWEYFELSSIVFSFILPAVFELTDLISTLTSFKFKTKKFKVSNMSLWLVVLIGLNLFIIPIFKPELTFPLIWISLFLIFDPINYMSENPSIIRNISKSDWEIPLSLLVSGIIIGFFWEFWNFWSYPKWTNTIPFFDFYRFFEIGVFGYVFYSFFSWELFALYHFIRSIGKSYLPKITNSIKGLISKK